MMSMSDLNFCGAAITIGITQSVIELPHKNHATMQKTIYSLVTLIRYK